jgi:hypothetical protein
VAAAAKRDTDAVEGSLAADLSVQDVLMRLGLPGKLVLEHFELATTVVVFLQHPADKLLFYTAVPAT